MSSSDHRKLDRVRQILERMERSIDDARDRRLREDGPPSPHSSTPATAHHGHSATPSPPPPAHAATPSAAGSPPAPTQSRTAGPVRFDEDGRPIVGRARAKTDRPNGPANTAPNAPGSPHWR